MRPGGGGDRARAPVAGGGDLSPGGRLRHTGPLSGARVQVRCPECHNSVEVPTLGVEVACPACMASFTPKPVEAPTRWMDVELRTPSGRLLGPWDRHLVREKIYVGELKGQEQVRPPNGDWVDIGSRPEFAEVLQLVGVDLGSQRISKQALRGWRKTGSAIEGGARPMTADEATRAMRGRPAAQEQRPFPTIPVAIGAAVLLALILGLWLM